CARAITTVRGWFAYW
nr:immunoglobulin heavy chain junction region [Mus musculus]NSM03709.1 immunoglobulin heavy chain junction region [Mus musculus]NSM03856.1 immunoglobulin heavy chain junction region [Mus musculus]NSM03876.1 immunoglobulin heavy chain junction region [Mus musculus]NSM03878.1 immunoglobulin heavy chain junction region [Mus musculus]